MFIYYNIFQSTPDLIIIEDDDKEEEVDKTSVNNIHKDIKKTTKKQVSFI